MQKPYDDFAQHFLKDNKDKMLLDVRNDDEVAQGILPEAVHIPLANLVTRIGEISPQKVIYIYCRSGKRAESAADILNQHGIKNVIFASNGGYDQLKDLIKEKST